MSLKKCIQILLVFSAFINGALQAQVPDSLRNLFRYDKNLPFNLEEKVSFVYVNPAVSLYHLSDSTKRGTSFHVRVKQIHYAINDSITAVAWLTTPHSFDSVTKRPAIIFHHWGEGNKDQFLSEAIEYSKRGFVCLLPDAIHLLPKSPFSSFIRHGKHIMTNGVINMQRGLDLLQKTFKINSRNVFFVGHSLGAGIGGILTGIDPRFQSFILLTPVYSNTRALRARTTDDVMNWKKNHPKEFEEWLTWMRPIDADHYLAHKTKLVFLQLATKDEFIPISLFKELEANTKQPKKVVYYSTLHALNEEAQKDRLRYILHRLVH